MPNDTPARLVPRARAFVEAVEREMESRSVLQNAREVNDKARAERLSLAADAGADAINGAEHFALGYRAAEAEMAERLATFEAEDKRCRALIGKPDSEQPLCSLLYDRLVFQGITPTPPTPPGDWNAVEDAIEGFARERKKLTGNEDRASVEPLCAARDTLIHAIRQYAQTPTPPQVLRELTDAEALELVGVFTYGAAPEDRMRKTIARYHALRPELLGAETGRVALSDAECSRIVDAVIEFHEKPNVSHTSTRYVAAVRSALAAQPLPTTREVAS